MSGRGVYAVADHFTHAARRLGYPARSVFKLKEIDERFKLLRPGQRVLDLGCVPGSWLLYAAQRVALPANATASASATAHAATVAAAGPNANAAGLTAAAAAAAVAGSERLPPLAAGSVLGVDINPMPDTFRCPFNATVQRGDIFHWTLPTASSSTPGALAAPAPRVDVLLSDMGHPTHGVRSLDSDLSLQLVLRAAQLAWQHVTPRTGACLLKVFEGRAFDAFYRSYFQLQYARTHIVKPKASRQESVELYVLGVGKRSATQVWVDTTPGVMAARKFDAKVTLDMAPRAAVAAAASRAATSATASRSAHAAQAAAAEEGAPVPVAASKWDMASGSVPSVASASASASASTAAVDDAMASPTSPAAVRAARVAAAASFTDKLEASRPRKRRTR